MQSSRATPLPASSPAPPQLLLAAPRCSSLLDPRPPFPGHPSPLPTSRSPPKTPKSRRVVASGRVEGVRGECREGRERGRDIVSRIKKVVSMGSSGSSVKERVDLQSFEVLRVDWHDKREGSAREQNESRMRAEWERSRSRPRREETRRADVCGGTRSVSSRGGRTGVGEKPRTAIRLERTASTTTRRERARQREGGGGLTTRTRRGQSISPSASAARAPRRAGGNVMRSGSHVEGCGRVRRVVEVAA